MESFRCRPVSGHPHDLVQVITQRTVMALIGTLVAPMHPRKCIELLSRHRQIKPIFGRDQVVVAIIAHVKPHPVDSSAKRIAGWSIVR